MPQHFVTPPEWHWYIVWYFFLGGIAGGAYALGTLLPEVDRTVSLLQLVQDEHQTVLTYGERPGTPQLAQLAHDVFAREGAAAVAALDGNFGALLIERETRSVWLCGTLFGHRALYHARAGAAFLAASHDLTLLATGLLPWGGPFAHQRTQLWC